MTREITHLKAFSAALDSLGQDRFTIGNLPPTPGIVDQYYNDSTGEGALGTDGVGSWIGLYGLKVADTPQIIKTLQDTLGDNTALASKSGSVPLQAQVPSQDKPSAIKNGTPLHDHVLATK